MTSKKSTLKQGTTNIYPQTTDDMVFIEGDADNKTLRNFMQETTSEITQLGQEVLDIGTLFIEFEEGRYINNFGDVSALSTFGASDFIPVSEGDKIIYSGHCGASNPAIAGYNSKRQFVSSLLSGRSAYSIVVIPAGISLIRVSGANQTHSNYLHRSAAICKNVEEVIDEGEILSINYSYPGYVGQDGEVVSSSLFNNTGFIPVYQGDVVELAGYSGSESNLIVAGYDENMEFVSSIQNVDGYRLQNYRVEIPSGVYFIKCSMANVTHSNYSPAKCVLKKSSIAGRIACLFAPVKKMELSLFDIKLNESVVLPSGNGFVAKSTGYIIASNPNFDYYVINNVGYNSLVATLYSNTTDCVSIAFYSTETISGNGIMPQSVVSSGSGEEEYSIKVPDYCKLIVLSNRSALGDATFEFTKNGIEKKVEYLTQKPLKDKNIAIIGDSISSVGGELNPYFKILSGDVGNQIQSYVSWFDVYNTYDRTSPTNKTIGGVALTEAMIGTLQSFTPVLADVGKSIGVPSYYYSTGFNAWYNVLYEYGAKEVINASYSGASMCSGQSFENYPHEANSYAWSDYTINRCKKRDEEGNNITPDIIIIYRGVNDMSHQQGNSYSLLTEYDIKNGYPANDNDGNGNFYYEQAYYLTIKKLRAAYPDAEIIICTLNWFNRFSNNSGWPTRNGLYTLPDINHTIRKIADTAGCRIINLDKDGITMENAYPKYINDSSTIPTHPNENGHKMIALQVIRDIF